VEFIGRNIQLKGLGGDRAAQREMNPAGVKVLENEAH
jgi:hypothetical protein